MATDPKIFAEAVRCKDLDKGQLKNVPFLKVRPLRNLHSYNSRGTIGFIMRMSEWSYVAVGLFCSLLFLSTP